MSDEIALCDECKMVNANANDQLLSLLPGRFDEEVSCRLVNELSLSLTR